MRAFASFDDTTAIWDADIPNFNEIAAAPNLYLPKNRTCLTPEEREEVFLPPLTEIQRKERGCPQFASDVVSE